MSELHDPGIKASLEVVELSFKFRELIFSRADPKVPQTAPEIDETFHQIHHLRICQIQPCAISWNREGISYISPGQGREWTTGLKHLPSLSKVTVLMESFRRTADAMFDNAAPNMSRAIVEMKKQILGLFPRLSSTTCTPSHASPLWPNATCFVARSTPVKKPKNR